MLWLGRVARDDPRKVWVRPVPIGLENAMGGRGRFPPSAGPSRSRTCSSAAMGEAGMMIANAV